ncbi:hypothetical protein MTBGP_01940 [Moorella thermoacetica]
MTIKVKEGRSLERFKFYSLTNEEKHSLLQRIAACLKGKEEIAFAYLHGSFLGEGPFRDIDLAVYINDEGIDTDYFFYEMQLEDSLRQLIPFPIDVRIINRAPLSFKYSVLKNGYLLIENVPNMRVDFEEHTLDRYFDFAPFRKRYFKETFGLEI